MKKKSFLVCFTIMLVALLPICITGRYHIYDMAHMMYKQVFHSKKTLVAIKESSFVDQRWEDSDSLSQTKTIDMEGSLSLSIAKQKEIVLDSLLSFYVQVDISQKGAPNIKYIINNKFDLQGKTINLPMDCVLCFSGGCLHNGILSGNQTSIEANDEMLFRDVDIKGTWNVKKIYSSWFSDIYEDNALKKLISLSSDKIHNDIYIREGEYSVSAKNNGDEILVLKSNTYIVCNGIIKLQPNTFDSYQIFRICKKNNIVLSGDGFIVGDRYLHTTKTGESGHGIVLRQSTGIKITGLTIKNFWGDGIAIGGTTGIPCKDVIVDSCTIENARRNGISIVYADHFKITNNHIVNIEGTKPERAIDIEPNPDCYCTNGEVINNRIEGKYGLMTALEGIGGNFIKNIIIKDNYFNCNADDYSSKFGRTITLMGDPEDIVVENNIIKDGGIYASSSNVNKGIVIKNNEIKGNIKIEQLQLYNNVLHCVELQCIGSSFSDNIINADVLSCGGNGGTALVASCSIITKNTINLFGGAYYFDCPITSRKDCEIIDNVINVSKETDVRYLVRVLAGTKTIIERNKVSKDLKVLDYGIGTIVNYSN